MDSKYNHLDFEQEIYQLWENSGAFNPDTQTNVDPQKEPFSIILPPPNANDPLHCGHALYVVEDILIRYRRLLGHKTLWLPGTDHAGIETQYVFEKKLKEKGQSRFDFDRDTLYKMIFQYVEENGKIAIKQLKRLGFALDWSRLKFTLDSDHIQRVYTIFNKLNQDQLLYRDEKIINYCTHCGTGFSNLEIDYKTVEGKLWTINYGPLQVATTRPETMLGDTAVAVNPKDPRYTKLIGTTITLPLANRPIPIITDDEIDPEFGTGAVKVTPSHSPVDYDIAKRHNLEFKRIFDYDGRANHQVPDKYFGLFPKQLRAAVIEDLKAQNLLVEEKPYSHEVAHCYKCGNVIEPITSPQWFIKIAPLVQKAQEAVTKNEIKFFPERFEEEFNRWMDKIKDWPISRQIVWGHRIPVWYNLDENEEIIVSCKDKDIEGITWSASWRNTKLAKSYEEVRDGLQSLLAPMGSKYYFSEKEALASGPNVLQETDTFDTWFSSGQWAYSTLGWDPNGNHSPDFKTFYPTSVMDTMWDILFFWVARMVMLGLYATGEIPFKTVHLHSRVVDKNGAKMSKSKGNVIEPILIADKYGADALRLALVFDTSPASDIALFEDKIRSQRNFINKIWNASRFIQMTVEKYPNYSTKLDPSLQTPEDTAILQQLNELITSTSTNLDKYNFGQASSNLYHFFWDEFCDKYIEQCKLRDASCVPVLLHILHTSLIMLHPFIPFVTEAIHQDFLKNLKISWAPLLIQESWPHAQV